MSWPAAAALRVRVRLGGGRIHRTARLVRPQHVSIGRECVVARYCEVGGGVRPEARVRLGDRVTLRENVHIGAQVGTIDIGDDCWIGRNTWIGGKGTISIGSNTMLGVNIVIVSSNHDYSRITRPYHEGPEPPMQVIIEEDVWIASAVVVLPGVTVGRGAVVGAGSVVTADVPPGSMAHGNPATVVRQIIRE